MGFDNLHAATGRCDRRDPMQAALNGTGMALF